MLNLFKNISTTELILIVIIFTVLFGGKAAMKLGKLGGETLREIKKIKKSVDGAIDDDEPQKNKKEVAK